MALLDAATAHFIFEVGSLSATDLQIADFQGREAISQPFRFDLRLVSTKTDIAFEDVLNKPATLSLMRPDGEERFHGIVMDFEMGERLDPQRVSYHAVLVPRLWILSLTHQSRVFQNKTVKDIVTDVLKAAGLGSSDFKWSLKASYPTREYTVQYRETDLSFVSRLLEHEGIFYFFDQTGDAEVLVLSDNHDDFKPIADPDEIIYRPPSQMAGDLPEDVDSFSLRTRIVTGKVLLKDYNYRTPEVSLKGESQLNKDGVGTYYDYGDHFKNTDDGNRLARVRNEEIESTRVRAKGTSDCRGLRAGCLFTLAEHFRDDYNQSYLLAEVLHEGNQARAMNIQADAEAPTYVNEFVCIPASAPYRPPRITPIPRLSGVLTAKIESSGGPYAHLDDQGRYRVRMPFDVGDSGKAGASRLVRLAQPYAGPNYGMHMPSHEGVEMIWACVDGDVDRPMGLGVAPNPSQMPPSTGKNKAQSVIRTAGNHEINMDDTQGSEMFFIHATKDNSVAVDNDQTITVGNNREKTIGNDQKEKVTANKTISVGSNHTEEIGADMKLKVGANETETIGANRKISVGGNHAEKIKGNMTIKVTGNLAESVSKSASQKVTLKSKEKVGTSKSTKVGTTYSLEVGTSSKTKVGTDASESVGGSKSVDVSKDFSESVGGKHSHSVTDALDVSAKTIHLTAKDEIILKTGKAKIVMKKNGDITVEGKGVNVKASDDIVMKGKKIQQN